MFTLYYWVRFKVQLYELRLLAKLQKRVRFAQWGALLTAVTIVCGFLSSCFDETHCPRRHMWFQGASLAAAAILGFLGFLLAIYSFRSILDRPRDIGEVLIRIANMLNNDRTNGICTPRILTLLCEYPAMGALSFRDSRAFASYRDALLQYNLGTDVERRIVLVAPPLKRENNGAEQTPTIMQDHITSYGIDYNIPEERVKAAIKANTEVFNSLRCRADRFVHHKTEPPRYQMAMLSELSQSRDQVSMEPFQAILWLVPRSSEKLSSKVTQSDQLSVSRTSQQQSKKLLHVGILAWEEADKQMLRELHESVKYIAKRKDDLTDMEFLSENDGK